MYYSTHLVVGATIGIATGHPLKAFIAGLASHIIMDLIPHRDHEKVINCLIDVMGGSLLFALWFFAYRPGLSCLVGSVAGVLPDIEIPLYYYRLISKRYFPSHSGWIPHRKAGGRFGLLVQLLTIVGMGIWVIS
ncbi:hypothetical protein [Thermincola potens]|uniref:Uncharacterized protein n=1 Tax=Thermincola potens (strain JR) TaxID=635013 RepID=D5XAU1_THEPJ|nr:hypothetical protein [Thermincola potens]ADG83295.1 hypothetical protein TherJR_2456 [Thermincola potens JR]